MTDTLPNRQAKKLLIGFLAIVVTVQLPVTWIICSHYFPGYNSVAQSLSELSAEDSPVKWAVRGSLILQAALMAAMSFTVPFTARSGKNILRLSAVFLVLAALISSPSQIEYSMTHRVMSFLAFAFGCLWPAFATRRRESGVVSKTTGVLVTVGFAVFTLIAWAVWAFASQTYFGVLQRINIAAQSLFIGWYWWRSFQKLNERLARNPRMLAFR
jgi:glucan phosphoethanolaminetransferase (alkaline phosphatase superfamily)